MNELQVKAGFSLQPTSFEEAMKFSELMANSSLVPPTFKGKPGDVLVAVQMGAELGLQPMQALQNVSVINGRPCVWGDAMLALVKAHREFEYIQEYVENDIAYCKVKRRGEPEHIQTFGIDDAKRAKLWGKTGPWTQYPKRMLQMRARGFAIRDSFPDALKGINLAEEVSDYDVSKTKDMGDAKVLQERDIKSVQVIPSCEDEVKSDDDESGHENNTDSRDGLATLDELEMLDELIFEKDVGDEVVSKWLIKAGAKSFDVMPRDIVLKCIDHLNG